MAGISSIFGASGSPAAASVAIPPDPKRLVDAVSKLNAAESAGPGNEIVVSISGHRLTIQVVNSETREVVQQICPQTVFKLAKTLNGG